MDYYKIKPLADGPFAFYDVQKLFALEYEENNKRVERMASKKASDVHLEAMEEAEDKDTKPDQTRNGTVEGIPKR